MNNITPEMRLKSLSDVKHSLVKRDMSTSLSRIDFAAHLNRTEEVKQLYGMIEKLDAMIKSHPLYKDIMLQCHRMLSEGN